MKKSTAKKYYKASSIVWWIAVFIWTINNFAHGWNYKAKSVTEEIFDLVVVYLLVIAISLSLRPIYYVAKEISLKYLDHENKL